LSASKVNGSLELGDAGRIVVDGARIIGLCSKRFGLTGTRCALIGQLEPAGADCRDSKPDGRSHH